jgi:rubrerythrin
MSEKTANAVQLLNQLADAETHEIEVDSRHIAATKNWLVRMFYDYGLEDAKRHLEISTMIRSWLEQGKPSVDKLDVSATELETEADSEASVGSLVRQLLDLVDDPDAKALLQSILSDEEKHEQGLRALKQRVLQQEEQ